MLSILTCPDSDEFHITENNNCLGFKLNEEGQPDENGSEISSYGLFCFVFFFHSSV